MKDDCKQTIEQKRLNYICLLIFDYDGYNTIDDLKDLLDEIHDIARGKMDNIVNEIYPD